MTRPTERLVAVDGISGAAIGKAARALASSRKTERPAISQWDASGILGEVAVADVGAGQPSARTLLLLYAADLAFRLRWDVRPALAAGRLVVVVPYVATAIAFGRAAGVDPAWLTDIFRFAPAPATHQLVDSPPVRAVAGRRGFVEFGCQQILGDPPGAARLELLERTATHLRRMAKTAAS